MAIKNSGSGDGLPLFSLYPNTKEIHLHMLFNLFNREWKSLNSHHLSTLCGMNTNVRYHDRKRGKKPKKICYSDTNGCFMWNRHASKCIACISVISNGTTVSRVSLLMQDVIRVSLQEQSVHVYIKRDNNVGLHCVKSSLQKRTHIWKFPCAKQCGENSNGQVILHHASCSWVSACVGYSRRTAWMPETLQVMDLVAL